MKINFIKLLLPYNIFKKIFTAAHCIQNKDETQPRALDSFYAFIGKYNLKADESGATRGLISSIRMHPDWDYNSTRYDADIALLVLKDKITFGTFVQPACLPTPTTNVFNTSGTIVGYGLTENLTTTNDNRPKFVEILSTDNENCFWDSHTFQVFGSRRTFCAGEQGKRACRGDSGGGFYVKSSGIYIVNGVVSAGSPDCNEDRFAVFTNVPKFVEWIRQEIAKDGVEVQGSSVTLECKFGKYNE
jgi:secreted trypsin-like serine protease